MSVEIVWLRQDLRLADNPLFHSVRPSGHLLCVYVLDQAWLTPLIGERQRPRIGPARLQFLWQSLIDLRGELLKRGSDLLVRIGNPEDVITELVMQLGATRVRVRHDAGYDETRAASGLARRLQGQAEVCHGDGGMLFDDVCLSARQIHDAVRDWEREYGVCESSYWVIFELLWREYFHWAARQEGRDLFGKRLLPGSSANFLAWCRGKTGMPFIDAAMRELASTGWLSNRARQNAASFLVRGLNVDWRIGAIWFEHCLIDHDVASNWGNWRYVAGVGRDPRQCGFDVHKQAEYYDPDGAYAALWQAPALSTHPEEP